MSPDGKYLVSGSQDCSVQIFDFETRVPLYHYQKLEKGRGSIYGWIQAVTVTPDSKFIVTGSENGSMRILNLDVPKRSHAILDAQEDEIYSVVITSDKNFVISASRNRAIKMFDLKTYQRVHEFKDVHEGKFLELKAL